MLALAALVIGWPWLSGRVTIPWDAKAHFQPQIQFLAQSLRARRVAVLGAFVFSGQPQIADPQSMIFSPPFLLLALVEWRARACGRSMPPCWPWCSLGGAALMLWFRDQGWHWAGGLIAALAFSYGASMAWRIQHIGQVLSLAYLPIALLCLDRALARRSIVYGVAAGVVAGVHRAGPRPGGAAGDLSARRPTRSGASLGARTGRAPRAPACCRSAAGAACALLLIAVPVAADRAAGRRLQPARDRLRRRRRAARCIPPCC